jgi:hypothetical protein
MRKEMKFNYGYLLVGIGVPSVIDRLSGPKFGLIAAILFAVAGVLLLIWGHLHREGGEPFPVQSRIGRAGIFMLIGAISGTGVIGIGWAAHHGVPMEVQPAKQSSSVVIPSEGVLNAVKKDLEEIKNNTNRKSVEKVMPPFAAEIDCVILTAAPKTTSNGFWITYNAPQGPSRTPAQVTIHVRLTNLQSGPAMISKYGIKMNNWKMTRMVTSPEINVFFSGCSRADNLKKACWLDDDLIIDKALIGLNLAPRTPISGWTLLEYPANSVPDHVDQTQQNKMKFWINLTDVEGTSFTSGPLAIRSESASESAQVRELSFTRGARDLTNYKFRDFYSPLI